MRIASRFAEAFLEDVYSDAIKVARLRRALKRVKKALTHILKTTQVPNDIGKLVQDVDTELRRQDKVEEVDMELIASVINKIFKIKDRGILVEGADLNAFVAKVEQQIERLTESYDFDSIRQPIDQQRGHQGSGSKPKETKVSAARESNR